MQDVCGMLLVSLHIVDVCKTSCLLCQSVRHTSLICMILLSIRYLELVMMSNSLRQDLCMALQHWQLQCL